MYDLAPAANSKLANISTRGFVDSGANVMIGGLIVDGGTGGGTARVILRAIGPSLAASGIQGVLPDPTRTARRQRHDHRLKRQLENSFRRQQSAGRNRSDFRPALERRRIRSGPKSRARKLHRDRARHRQHERHCGRGSLHASVAGADNAGFPFPRGGIIPGSALIAQPDRASDF